MKALLVCSLLLIGNAMANKNLKPYPPAEEGMTRHVIELAKLPDESDAKVELIVGKTVMTDPVNRHSFGGKLEQGTVKGWGYGYHKLAALGPMMSTRMAPAPGTPDIERFITVGGEPYIIRYNSKLPVVVYVPKGCEVKYRIWTAPAETEPVPEG